MNNTNQQPPNDNNKPDQEQAGPPPRRTGLLSNYAQQSAKQPTMQPGSTPQPAASEKSEQPRKTGLLSGYAQQNATPPPVTNHGGASPINPAPGKSSFQSPAPVPPMVPPVSQGAPRNGGLLSGHRPANSFVSNTMQTVRSWSGKLAAVAGYKPEPPAPEMERYHSSMPMAGSFGAAQGAQPQYKSTRKPWKRSRTTRIIRQMRNRRERWSKNGPATKIWSGIAIALFLLLVVTSFSSTAYGYTYYQNQLPQLQRLAASQISQTTRIYDRNGVLIYDVSDDTGRRTPVSYQDIPQALQDAQVAAEDGSFWTNPVGINPQAIVRSALTHYGGGSTITQQVVKNLSHNEDASIQRKIPEAAMAIGLTQEYPKWKVLEMYFNVAPYGSLNLGVESAIQDYFGLQPQCDQNFKCVPAVAQLDLDTKTNKHDPLLGLARASLLAGIPQQPVAFDVSQGAKQQKAAFARQDYVLNQMLGMTEPGIGKITPAIVSKVEDITTHMTFNRYQPTRKAQHFAKWISGQVEAALGNGDTNAGTGAFLTGGFNIRTTLDINLENYAEAEVTRHITQPEIQQFQGHRYLTLNKDDNLHNAAVVVMNSKTGEVLAMDGAVDYNDPSLQVAGNYNMATEPRQPGSTFKPFVYATAFQMGLNPGTVLPDFPTYFPNGLGAGAGIPLTPDELNNPRPNQAYRPSDYGGGFNNLPTTIRMATANSFNVPAVKALQIVGLDNITNTVARLGLLDDVKTDAAKLDPPCATNVIATSPINCYGMSLVLGTAEVPLVNMVNAYQSFANQGQKVPAQGVLDIWDNYGHNLYHFDPAAVKGQQVFSPQVSYMMTSVLMDEVDRAREFLDDHDLSFTDRYPVCASDYLARTCPYQVAAKTGTTDSFKDNWTIGYTPNVVVGVWAGNTNQEPMKKGVVGITGAAPIWHSVMEYASNGWCGQDRDGVPCPEVDRAKLNLGATAQFPVPDGISLSCGLNSYNGLQGSGAPCDWVINGQTPLQSGMPPDPAKDPAKQG
ncbi:transglycosylase domain-containing protein [Tengunoibacter tsumagoiensis]|uniref:Uncharacterized protein n=1 Tax=Tengunoibacter tsumagoiensis TaxID=2014871 RepID=A0A401ZWX1_9CHLR|nr:transglycosylase domain-containing protein [Tengunoibacter tsumagoiensis]GCE11357.1 hypothetical protein KTT_12160 [Tengunoibacter tsumagoiensis]